MEQPLTNYVKSPDGLWIAYQTVGTGPEDVLFFPYCSCVDRRWDEPTYAHSLERLASIGRLIGLDPRGTGASDPVPLGSLPTPETWMEDVRVVFDEVGSRKAAVVVQGTATFFGLIFAATYPERTSALVVIDGYARALRDDDYPHGLTPAEAEVFCNEMERSWGTGASAGVVAPSRATDRAFRRWHASYERGTSSPGVLGAVMRWQFQLDVRAILPSIRVPTLVLHQAESLMTPVALGRYIAENIPDARFEELPGADTFIYSDAADEVIDLITEFVTGAPPVREPDRALATVLFTDIVSSTERAATLGDTRWRRTLDQHDAVVGRELERHRGRKVNPTGDGVLATFDGPARAVRCAQAIVRSVTPLGIEVRAGLHTGEVEVRGRDIGGIAVHIGQRVSAFAGPGEVLVSRTVTDLVAGSGLEFEERGEHELKGVPGKWAVYAVKS
jgi:class 3 adenylate cyclase